MDMCAPRCIAHVPSDRSQITPEDDEDLDEESAENIQLERLQFLSMGVQGFSKLLLLGRLQSLSCGVACRRKVLARLLLLGFEVDAWLQNHDSLVLRHHCMHLQQCLAALFSALVQARFV